MSEVLAQLEKKGGDNKTYYFLACNFYGQYSTLFVDGVPQDVDASTSVGGYTFAGINVTTYNGSSTITNNSGVTIYAAKQDSLAPPMYTAIPNGSSATVLRACVCAVV